MHRSAAGRAMPVVCLVALAGCQPAPTVEPARAAATVTHAFDLDATLPPHLAVMFSMSWFGISAKDPQGAGPDPSYANASYSNSCAGSDSAADPTTCDDCVLRGTGDACLQHGAAQRRFASRRKPLAGIYSASARDAEGQARVDLMLSTLRRPCDDGARLDAWSVQLNGTRDTYLHPSNPRATAADIAAHALAGFLDRADAAGLRSVVMPGDDSTWYFHFGDKMGLGTCDDTQGNPKQNCIDALTDDFADMVAMAQAHPSAVRAGGRPLFQVYFDPAQLTPAQWKSIFDTARDRTGQDFYVLGAVQNPSRGDYFQAFDALAPWVQLAWGNTSGADLRARSISYASNLHGGLYAAVGSYPGRVVFGGVSPGFDDFTLDWAQCKERQLPPGSDARAPDFLEGQFDYLDTKQPRGILFETWDDWTEGTEFEPDVAGGTEKLVALRRRLGGLYGDAADPAGDARLDARWTQYGQARNCAGGQAGTPPVTDLTCPAAPDGGGAGTTGDDGGTGAGGGGNDAGSDGSGGGTPGGHGAGGCALVGAGAASGAPPWAIALIAVVLVVGLRRRRA